MKYCKNENNFMISWTYQNICDGLATGNTYSIGDTEAVFSSIECNTTPPIEDGECINEINFYAL
jgi:hypothetical protein